jgi:hypothetical protein
MDEIVILLHDIYLPALKAAIEDVRKQGFKIEIIKEAKAELDTNLITIIAEQPAAYFHLGFQHKKNISPL